MREKKFERCLLLAIVVLAVVVRLFFAFSFHEVWWDSGVYIGMGKYLFSGGESGLFEHIRPPLVPIGLGLLWLVGLDPVLFGRLVEIVLMAGVVYLTFALGREWFGARTGILAALVVAFSPIFFYLSFHQYTEIPSVFFVLLGLYLAVNGYPFLAGISLGLAFLAKFPAGMFIGILVLFLFAQKKWSDALFAVSGFALAAVPYFAASWFAYGGVFATLAAGQSAIDLALGCNVLRYRPWWYYFYWLVFSETKLHVFAIPGLFFTVKNWSRNHVLWALSLAVPLLYFVQLHCRDYRYLTLFLPFVAMLSAFGVVRLLEWKSGKKAVFVLVLLILGGWMGHTALLFYAGNEVRQPSVLLERYLGLPDELRPIGEVWVSHPSMAAYTDARLEKVYYPIYNEGLVVDFLQYLRENNERVGAVFLDNCGGGIICPLNEASCTARTDELITTLDQNFVRVFDEQEGRCWYRAWVRADAVTPEH